MHGLYYKFQAILSANLKENPCIYTGAGHSPLLVSISWCTHRAKYWSCKVVGLGVTAQPILRKHSLYFSEPEGGFHPEHQADADPGPARTHAHLRVRHTAHQQETTQPNTVFNKTKKHRLLMLDAAHQGLDSDYVQLDRRAMQGRMLGFRINKNHDLNL